MTEKDEKTEQRQILWKTVAQETKKTRILLSWQQHTIRLLAVEIGGEGTFSGEGIFHGTLRATNWE